MTTIDLDIQWGGYYSMTDEDGLFRVLRLLDFDSEAYHAALFGEKFDTTPTFEDCIGLSPFVQHVPMATRRLVKDGVMTLIGSQPLEVSDLVGYATYLKQHDVDGEAIGEAIARAMHFSTKEPLKLRLTAEGGELQIAERQ